jgi:hypothetical protein
MKNCNITLITGIIISLSGLAQAGSYVINDKMTRRAPDSESGSGDLVEVNCPKDYSGNDWQGATATLKVSQKGSGSRVKIKVRDAVPDTLFTVWLRIKGENGLNPEGSPLTGGPATALAPGSELDALNDISPWGIEPEGASSSANSFITNARGKGKFIINLDFPIVRGTYPFNLTATSKPDQDEHTNVPTAIADPREPGQEKTPFLIRVVSHCTDNASHGLSAGEQREAWFQYP